MPAEHTSSSCPAAVLSRGSSPEPPGPVLYSTAPPYQGGDAGDYARQLASVARWSEEAGCEGILVYTDNSLLDPWLCAQIVIQSTREIPFTNYKTFCPYLVGSYERVGSELARYFQQGCSAMILDVPIGTEELGHVKRAIRCGAELAVRA